MSDHVFGQWTYATNIWNALRKSLAYYVPFSYIPHSSLRLPLFAALFLSQYTSRTRQLIIYKLLCTVKGLPRKLGREKTPWYYSPSARLMEVKWLATDNGISGDVERSIRKRMKMHWISKKNKHELGTLVRMFLLFWVRPGSHGIYVEM